MTKYLQYFEESGTVNVLERNDEGQETWIKTKINAPIYCKVDEETDHKSIYRDNLKELEFDNITHLRKFLKENPEAKTNLYGTVKHSFGAVVHRNYELAKIDDYRICYFDIETECENGFPHPELAEEEVNMITLKRSDVDIFDVWTTCEIDPAKVAKHAEIPLELLNIKVFANEFRMLLAYIDYFKTNNIHVYGGWNSEKFDVYYMCNRIKKILGEHMLEKMSIFDKVTERTYTDEYSREIIEFKFRGLDHVDFMQQYKKRVFGSRENYSLDFIAKTELGAGKLEHESGIPGHLLYAHGFASEGLAYNIVDVKRLEQIINKTKVLELEITLAQMCSLNISDTIFVTRIILAYAHKFLLRSKEHMPLQAILPEFHGIEGGYVQAVIPGLHKYILSGDLASSYPSNMRALNISPDTKGPKLPFVSEDGSKRELHDDDMLAGFVPEKMKNPKFREKWTMAPNGQCFTREFRGFLPRMLDELYDKRNEHKFAAKEAYIKYAETKDKYFKLEAEIQKMFDLVIKRILNSAYGAFASANFLFSDPDIGGAVTAGGRLCVKRMIEYTLKFSNNPNNMEKALKMYCRQENLSFTRVTHFGVKDYKIVCVASDTDSQYISYASYIDQLSFDDDFERDRLAKLEYLVWFGDNIMQIAIDKAMDKVQEEMNTLVNGIIKADREVVAVSGIWTAKKKYSLLTFDVEGARFYPDYKAKTQGLSLIQSAISERSKDKLKEFLKVLLLDSSDNAYDLIMDYRTEFNDIPFEEIAKNENPKSFEKYADPGWNVQKLNTAEIGAEPKYRGPTAPGRAAINHNRIVTKNERTAEIPLLINGTGLRTVFLRMPNPVGDDIIAWEGTWPSLFKELDIEKYIDYNKQFDKAFMAQIDRLYNSLNINPRLVEEFDLF